MHVMKIVVLTGHRTAVYCTAIAYGVEYLLTVVPLSVTTKICYGLVIISNIKGPWHTPKYIKE